MATRLVKGTQAASAAPSAPQAPCPFQPTVRPAAASRWRSGREELLFVLDRHWKRLGRTLDTDDFTDAQAIATIERITRGDFRLLERLFPQITRVLKINRLNGITDDVIEAAASIQSSAANRHRALTERRQIAITSTDLPSTRHETPPRDRREEVRP